MQPSQLSCVRKKATLNSRSEVRRLKAEAQASDQRFHDLIQGVDAVVWEGDATTFQFTFVSQQAEEILGYPAEQWLSEPNFWRNHIHRGDRDRTIARRRAETAAGRDYQLEYRIIAADGRVVWLRDRVRMVRDQSGQPQRCRGIMIDISAHRRAEEGRRRLIAVLEATPDLVAIADPDGRDLYLNQAGRRLLGLGENEISIPHVTDHQPPWAKTLLLEEGIPTALRDGVWRGETAFLNAEGRAVAVSQVLLAHRSPDGNVDFFATVARDISTSKRAEAEKAALLDIAKDATGTLDLDQILARVLRRTATVLPCERVVTYYWEPARNSFRDIAQYGVPDDLARDAWELEFHAGQPMVDLLTSGQTMTINDVNDQPWVPAQLLAHFRITALLGVPLAVRGRVVGALIAINPGSGHFEAAQVQLFQNIASHVALVIEATDLYRSQRDEARVAAALARVGQEMASSLDAPIILDRLCQLTTEVLECDSSHTLLWDEQEDAYIPVSGFGDPPEHWETIRLLKVPRSAVAQLTDPLERDEAMQLMVPQGRHLPIMQLVERYGFTVCMYVALRRGGDVIGYQAACFRGRMEPFTPQQQRLFRGIGQIASLALANARLVEELERASRVKSDFVATMSHELRTPLNVILGYNELLSDGAFGGLTAEQQDIVQRIEQSGHELLTLVNTALDLSRLEAGHLPVDIGPVRLPTLIAEIDADIRELRERSGLRFAWDVAPELPELRTDATKLKVVLKNLIDNALKFTDEGGVTVSIVSQDGRVEFTVTDTGIGIPPEAQPFIFEAFRQADSSMTRRHGGVGLGLYIVRRFVEMLGGAISCDTEVGRGSVFRLWLPTSISAGSA